MAAGYSALVIGLLAVTIGTFGVLASLFREDLRIYGLTAPGKRPPPTPTVFAAAASPVVDERPLVMIQSAPYRVATADFAGTSERDDSARPWFSGGRARTYRTVCVRLCDGFFFPISFSTTRENFKSDEAACRSRCAAPARLFALDNPGGRIETMRDKAGRRYSALPTAFLFRRTYDPSCTCKGQPWDQDALARHRAYALMDGKRTGDKEAAAELKELKRELKGRLSVSRESGEVATAALAQALDPQRKPSRKARTVVADGGKPRPRKRKLQDSWGPMMSAGVVSGSSAGSRPTREASVGEMLRNSLMH